MNDTGHVMIDIETLGTNSNSVILSIGAVKFDLKDLAVGIFHIGIDIQSCLDAGLQVDGGTIDWWMKQKDENIKRVAGMAKYSLRDALALFEDEVREHKYSYLWSHGSNFDIVILENAYKAIGKKAWWKYSCVRDTRTLFDLADYKYVSKGGHDALEDAMSQAKAVSVAYQQLKRG